MMAAVPAAVPCVDGTVCQCRQPEQREHRDKRDFNPSHGSLDEGRGNLFNLKQVKLSFLQIFRPVNYFKLVLF
jgi:hypothetical protein